MPTSLPCPDVKSSNALPWRSLHCNKEHLRRVKFVDVDSPDVIKARCETIKLNSELTEALTDLKFHSDSRIILSSDQLCQVACDLSQLQSLTEALFDVTKEIESEYLFIAETSFSRLEAEAADALISWAGSLGHAQFCLLGQMSPNVPATMRQPARSKSTGQSAVQYPTISSQQQRFRDMGWPDIKAWTLWEAWSDPMFMSPDQRRELDTIEPFHDWEEFAGSTSSHFMLWAQNTASLAPAATQQKSRSACDMSHIPTVTIALNFSPSKAPKCVSPRRFGAPMLIKNVFGDQFVANAFGEGVDGHLRSHDLYGQNFDPGNPSHVMLPQGGPGARSCFTLTDLGNYGFLLCGGKTSLAEPFNDCWIFKTDVNQWTKTHSLPLPLFGHMAEQLGRSQLVLLAGGRSTALSVHGEFLLYHPNIGWVPCSVRGDLRPTAVFGGLLLDTTPSQPRHSRFQGILAGGMTADALVCDNVYDWALDISDIAKPTIEFTLRDGQSSTSFLARYGAITTRVDGWSIVAGGITSKGCIPQSDEIVHFYARGREHEKLELLDYATKLGAEIPRPIFTGASIIATENGDIVLVGGGASKPSSGIVWSRGIYSFNTRPLQSNGTAAQANSSWEYQKTLSVTNEATPRSAEPSLQRVGLSSAVPIPRLKLHSAEQFSSILHNAQPVVFEGLDLGPCLSQWKLPYLVERVGPDRKVRPPEPTGPIERETRGDNTTANTLPLKVVVHDSSSQAMDFLAKNFSYKTQTFSEFSRDVDAGKKLYLRALSADKPSDTPARLDTDFPSISQDFILPPQLALVQERLFSSVLRVSGPVNMWLHYDVSE